MAVHHDTGHSHDSGSGASAAAAGWMLTTLLVAALLIALIVALFVWSPWSSGGSTPVQDTGSEQSGDRDIDIRGDIDVNPDGQGSSGEGSGQ